MPEISTQETQQELFQEFSGESSKKRERFPGLSRTPKPILISTSVEQIILAGIFLILIACLVFFLGVLRGKSLAGTSSRPAQPAPITALAQKSAPAPSKIPPPVSPAKTQPVKPKISSPAVVMKADLSKPYTLQLVTYKKQDLAEREVAALRGRGLYSFIIPSGEYYQVCAGQYSNKEEAKNDLKVLSPKYKGCFLRRR
jgi:hypothetical protein